MKQTELFPESQFVTVRRPAWLPEGLKQRLRETNRLKYRFQFSRPERKAFRKHRPLPVSEWAARHRILTMSSLPGQWQNEITPYLVGIMDASRFPSVRVSSVCKGPQSGVTEAAHNFVGHLIDRDPGPVLYCYPDEITARENAKDRIEPMITSSVRLRSYFTGRKEDSSSLRINLSHMPIYLAWARSASRLGNKPIRYAIADEVDKYPATAGKKEAGPLQLIDKRLTTYRAVSKYWRISTPTIETGPIWQDILLADAVFHFWARCPACGEDQVMEFDRIKWPEKERDPRKLKKEKLAWYECKGCGAKWDDHLRDKAVSLGHWRAQGPKDPRGMELFAHLKSFRPEHIAFHLPAWVTRFVSLSECAAAFLDGQSDFQKLKDFMNNYKAEPWRQITVSADASEILQARCGLPPQTVPEEAVALTCGVDVQKLGFWFAVRAWARDYSSWLVHFGHLATWEDVEQVLFKNTYPVAGSKRGMRIWRAAVDTGGGDKGEGLSMTEETYFWLRKNMVGRGCRVWGTKGASWAQVTKVKPAKAIDKTPSGKPLPGGLQILMLDTDKLKDTFFYRLSQAMAGGSQAAYLHAGGDQEYREYYSHITAEEKRRDEKGVEVWVKKRARNDLLDCECLAAACADPEWPEGGIHLLPPPEEPAMAAPKPEPAAGWLQNREYQRPGWLNRG